MQRQGSGQPYCSPVLVYSRRARRPYECPFLLRFLGHPQVRETKIGPPDVAPRSNSLELLRALAVHYSAVTCPRLVFGDVGACDSFLLHGYRQATLDDLAILRVAFEDGTPLGWEAVHAFEEQQGIVLPEPYRTCVAEITDGAAGPRTTSWS